MASTLRAGPGPNRTQIRSPDALAGRSISAPIQARNDARISDNFEFSAMIVSCPAWYVTCAGLGGACSGVLEEGGSCGICSCWAGLDAVAVRTDCGALCVFWPVELGVVSFCADTTEARSTIPNKIKARNNARL